MVGQIAGTTGRSLRLEAIEVKMIRDESAIEATREALNDSLDTYKAALSTVKDELTQKGYDKLAKQITEAMEKISEAETIEEMEKIYEEVMDAIIKAKPAAAKGQYIRSVAISTTMGPGLYIDQK